MKFILIILLISMHFSLNAKELASCKKTVGMWTLMLWFNDKGEGFEPWEQYVRISPVFGQYNSYDDDWIDYTIDNAVDLGVDYLILDNTNGVFRHSGMFDKVIEAFLRRIRIKKSQLQIVIAKGYSVFEKKDFDLLEKSMAHLERYFSDPAYLMLDQKPMLILYINSDDSIVNLVKKAGRDTSNYVKYIDNNDLYGFKNYFKNISLRYNSGYDSWIKDNKGVYGWRFDYPQVVNQESMGVMPGWNRSHNDLKGTEPIGRSNGEYYIKSWQHVLKSNPCNVVITSWDDWAEETAIAPSGQWGRLYFDLTKEFISEFKNFK